MPTFAQVSRLSLKNILLPTDLSPTSRAAVPFARALAEIYGSTILFAHAVPPEPHLQVPLDRLPAQDDVVWQDARQRCAEFVHDQSLGAIPHKILLDRGDVGDVIPAMIEEEGIDMVILATHGRRGVTKVLLGSAAEKIYRSATCSVLTVGPKARESRDWKLRRILCPVDISEDPEPVLQYALSLAEENQSKFIVMQSIPLVPWQHRAAVEMQARLGLENLIPEQAKDWCVPEFVVRWEHPATAILHEAESRGADLVVMSVHRSRAISFSAHLPWAVASEVVSRAPCPVLTVRI